MSFLMVRHTKADLIEIPTPVYSTTDVTLSPSETITVRLINIHFIINYSVSLVLAALFFIVQLNRFKYTYQHHHNINGRKNFWMARQSTQS